MPCPAAWSGVSDRPSEKPPRVPDCVRLRRENLKPFAANAPNPGAQGRQPLVGIIRAQAQAVFRPAREHAVRLRNATGHEIVDHHPDIRVSPRHGEVSRPAARPQRGVDARDEPLPRSLFIPGRAVDLPCQEEPRQPLHFQRQVQLAWIDVIIFDRVARPENCSLLEARDRLRERRAEHPPAMRSRCRLDRRCDHPGLRAREGFDGFRDP